MSFQQAQISSRYRGDTTHIIELKNLEDNCHSNTKFLGMIPNACGFSHNAPQSQGKGRTLRASMLNDKQI